MQTPWGSGLYSGPPTLHQEVDDDGVKAQRVGGRAGVVARILGFDRAQNQSPVGQNESLPVQRYWNGCILTGKQSNADFLYQAIHNRSTSQITAYFTAHK